MGYSYTVSMIYQSFRTVTFLVSSFKYLHSYHPLARSKYLVLLNVRLFLESGIGLFQLPLQLVSLCLLCHSVLSMLFSYTYNGDDKLFVCYNFYPDIVCITQQNVCGILY